MQFVQSLKAPRVSIWYQFKKKWYVDTCIYLSHCFRTHRNLMIIPLSRWSYTSVVLQVIPQRYLPLPADISVTLQNQEKYSRYYITPYLVVQPPSLVCTLPIWYTAKENKLEKKIVLRYWNLFDKKKTSSIYSISISFLSICLLKETSFMCIFMSMWL